MPQLAPDLHTTAVTLFGCAGGVVEIVTIFFIGAQVRVPMFATALLHQSYRVLACMLRTQLPRL